MESKNGTISLTASELILKMSSNATTESIGANKLVVDINN
jgi:hypothetical protein